MLLASGSGRHRIGRVHFARVRATMQCEQQVHVVDSVATHRTESPTLPREVVIVYRQLAKLLQELLLLPGGAQVNKYSLVATAARTHLPSFPSVFWLTRCCTAAKMIETSEIN